MAYPRSHSAAAAGTRAQLRGALRPGARFPAPVPSLTAPSTATPALAPLCVRPREAGLFLSLKSLGLEVRSLAFWPHFCY